jgi:lipopolysaccharide/colanic/teichoic acid biosynthesis glycosyltransferase
MFREYTLLSKGFLTLSGFIVDFASLSSLCLICLFIRLIYGKPVLIGEERRGYRGNVFKMLRFRPISKNGKFDNEKAGLDMLPALINVIKGDLSLVGPWPPTIFETLSYKPRHILRLSAKPGITGLWRIYRTDRGNVDEMTKVDLKYIRERNLRFDLYIFLKTISMLIRPQKEHKNEKLRFICPMKYKGWESPL